MTFDFQPMNEASARAIFNWHYEPPYDIYDPGGDAAKAVLHAFLDPGNAYYRIIDDYGNLVAYCCFGPEGQVPGGNYAIPALDIGLGVRPDWTGQKCGHLFVEAVLAFAQAAYAPARFRVTVAEFNERALRVWKKAGFAPVQRFARNPDGLLFVLLERPG